jgi:hypothetical protein
MQVSDHLHSPAALTLEKEPAVPIKDEAGQCIRASLGRFGEGKKSNQTCWKSNHGSFSPCVSNPRPARLYDVARGHISKLCLQYKIGNVRINVTMRHVRPTIAAVEKQ